MEYQKISSKFVCRFCKEKFDQPKFLYLHVQQAHSSAPDSKDNRTCPLCAAQCAKYEGYRDHLLHIHGQRSEGQKLTFKCLNDFLLWRSELEKKHNCKYSLQSAPKILPSNDKQYIYQCNRSDPKIKEKKNTVVMRTCPSVISVIELSGNQQLKVEYWDTHSGHNTSGIPVSKEELAVAVNSVEIDHVIEDYEQSCENAEDYLSSEDPNGILIKSSNPIKKSHNQHGSNLAPSTSTATGQNSKIIQSKVDANKKKSTATSVLYSLASVACGKTPVSKKSDTSSTTRKGEGSSEVNASSESSPKKVDAKDTSKTVGGKVAIGSVKHPPKTDTAAIMPVSTTSTSQISSTGSISQLPASHLTNNNAFTGQVLLINPLSVGQEAVNATPNVFSPGQNILFSFGSVGQNIVPSGQATVALGEKMETGEIETSSLEKNVSSEPSSVKKAASTRKRKISASNSAKPATQSNLNGVTTGIVNPVVSTTDVINPPGSTVLLSSLPVGSTFMTINNNLVPVRNTPTNFLSQNSLVLAPAVPGSTAENKVISTPLVNLTPKPVIAPHKIGTTIPQVLSQSHTINISEPATAIATSSSVRETSINPSSLNAVANNVISFSSSVLNNLKNTVSVSGLTKTVPSVSSQNVIDALPLNTIPISSTPAINMPSIPSQKPGTLFFESGGDIYMLEPIENEVPKDQCSPAVTTKPAPNKVKESKTKQSPVSKKKPEEAGESIVFKKRTLADDDDATVLQKLKYYQLELKYLASQEECKKLKIEIAKQAKSKNKGSQDLEIDAHLNKSSEGSEYQDEVNKYSKLVKEYEDRLKNDTSIYTMVRTSVLRDLYSDLEKLCDENKQLFNELDSYRKHDKFYKSLRKKLEEEEF